MFISFLSDFGLQDDFVGTCHGVIKRIAPDAQIVDITHGIEPQAVLQGALVLANTVPYMPEGVHLAVVDPGVGSGRRGLVLRDAAGRLYVGPDNGLLVPAAEKLGGVVGAWELTNAEYMFQPVSRTFHGRDVFAPAAAHLATGVAPGELGPPVDPATLTRIALPVAEIGQALIRATALYVDRYGNVQLNLSRADLERARMTPGSLVDLGPEQHHATVATTFADAASGEIILYEDAYESIAVAITGGNAAETLSLHPGQELTIRLPDAR